MILKRALMNQPHRVRSARDGVGDEIAKSRVDEMLSQERLLFRVELRSWWKTRATVQS